MYESTQEDQLDAINLIRCLGNGSVVKTDLKTYQKVRHAPKKLQILYQFHLFEKNVRKGRWSSVFAGIQTIADCVKCSNVTVDRFIASEEIKYFIDIDRYEKRIKGRFTTHTYKIKNNISEALTFLERHGFFHKPSQNMKGEKYFKWREGFNCRLDAWLIKKLESGMTFQQIDEEREKMRAKATVNSLNNLSTENVAKCATVNAVNEPIRLPSGGLTTLGILRHDAISFEFNDTLRRMETLGFTYSQRENFGKNNPPRILSEATKMLEQRMQRGDLDAIPNPGGYLQSNINFLRFGKRRR